MTAWRTVVVGGGTGFIGSYITQAFAQNASKVITVSRMPGVDRINWHDIKHYGLPEETDVVVNVSGQNVLDPFRGWSEGFRQNVMASRINTTASLAEAVVKSKNPPKTFITISGVGYYPPHPSKEYDELSPGGIKTEFFSNLCREWESAGDLPEDCPTRRVVIRSGVVLGHGGGIIKQISLPFWFGLGGRIASGKQFFPWIHVEDLVRMFLFAAEEEHVKGILNGVSPDIITNEEFTKALGRAMWRPTLIPMPEKIVDLAFDKERAFLMTRGQKVIPRRTQELGYTFRYEKIREACQNVMSGSSLKPDSSH